MVAYMTPLRGIHHTYVIMKIGNELLKIVIEFKLHDGHEIGYF